jgi:hypothetical protein
LAPETPVGRIVVTLMRARDSTRNELVGAET